MGGYWGSCSGDMVGENADLTDEGTVLGHSRPTCPGSTSDLGKLSAQRSTLKRTLEPLDESGSCQAR
jgi:hypothetical protein